MKQLHKRFEKNTVGKDYIVGDVHGCFTALQEVLDKVNFNTNTDRLFSVGDLVDRGPYSEDSIKWIAQPWFHCVTGNHEQMAVDWISGIVEYNYYFANGGTWMSRLSREEQLKFLAVFQDLPIAFSIETDEELPVGVIHADCPFDDWNKLITRLETIEQQDMPSPVDEIVLNELVWSRTRAKAYGPYIENISRLFVGHTPINAPMTKQNVVFIDNGAVFGKDLLLLDLKGNVVAKAKQEITPINMNGGW